MANVNVLTVVVGIFLVLIFIGMMMFMMKMMNGMGKQTGTGTQTGTGYLTDADVQRLLYEDRQKNQEQTPRPSLPIYPTQPAFPEPPSYGPAPSKKRTKLEEAQDILAITATATQTLAMLQRSLGLTPANAQALYNWYYPKKQNPSEPLPPPPASVAPILKQPVNEKPTYYPIDDDNTIGGGNKKNDGYLWWDDDYNNNMDDNTKNQNLNPAPPIGGGDQNIKTQPSGNNKFESFDFDDRQTCMQCGNAVMNVAQRAGAELLYGMPYTPSTMNQRLSCGRCARAVSKGLDEYATTIGGGDQNINTQPSGNKFESFDFDDRQTCMQCGNAVMNAGQRAGTELLYGMPYTPSTMNQRLSCGRCARAVSKGLDEYATTTTKDTAPGSPSDPTRPTTDMGKQPVYDPAYYIGSSTPFPPMKMATPAPPPGSDQRIMIPAPAPNTAAPVSVEGYKGSLKTEPHHSVKCGGVCGNGHEHLSASELNRILPGVF